MNNPLQGFPSARRANYTLAVLLVAYVLSFIDRQILSLLVGPIRKDLGISDFQMSFLQGIAFALFYALLGIPIGRLADRGNRKKIIAVGIFLWSLMTAVCGLAKNYGMLFFARMGVGVGEAALSPAAYSIFADSFPPARLARAASIFSLGITIGSGLAFIIGGKVVEMIAGMQPVTLPVLGTLHPWQLTFFAVGLPGLFISALSLTILDPPRRGLLQNAQGQIETIVPFAQVLGFMRARWRCYAAIFGGVALFAIVGYGTMAWYPAFLMRTFDMPVGQVGLRFGLIYLVFGTAGSLCAALLSERFSKRGYRDANVRVMLLVAISVILPAAIGPLMPSANLALLIVAPTTFLQNAYFGVAIASLQLIAPNQMRAMISAIFLFVANLLGMGIGPSAVALLTDFVFQHDQAVRYSLAVLAAGAYPIAALIFWRGLKHYRQALDEASAWNG
jgi:MFS family permease